MIFSAKKNSGRRSFLRRAGGGILGLPLLEYTHGTSWAQGSANKRFVTVFSHGGTVSPRGRGSGLIDSPGGESSIADRWHPTGLGSSFTLGEIQQPLASFQNKLLFVTGLDNKAVIAQGPYKGGHGIANVTALTCADYRITGAHDEASPFGPSIDKVIAERLAAKQSSRFESIHLRVSGHQYGSPYFKGSEKISSGESNPVSAFNRIFEGVEPGAGPDPALVRRNTMRRHVLNGTMDAFASLRGVVSAHDRQVLDAHFDHLSALAAEIESLADGPLAACTPPSNVDDGNGNIVGSAHAKIVVAALRCGLTNVANLEISDILAPWTPSGLQVESSHNIGHSLGHIQRSTGQGTDYERRWIREMVENRQWRMSILREILEGLDDPAFAEGGNTMLDNSIVYYTSEFGAPESHSSHEVPTLVFGSAGGRLKQGQHITFNTKRGSDALAPQHQSDSSLHNLYTTFLQAFGESDNHFGNNDVSFKGPLTELLT